MNKGINCKIVETKNGITELEIEGQKLLIPEKNLPLTKTKKYLKVFFLESECPIDNKKLAKMILEEILNGK